MNGDTDLKAKIERLRALREEQAALIRKFFDVAKKHKDEQA